MRYYFKLSASHSRPSLRRFPAAAALVLASAALAAEPLTTAFTYQGHLQNVSGPASGPQAMVFQLYDAASGGNPVGPALVFDGQGGNPPPVVVADGLFTASLDFGAGVFDGQRRCLQVTVAEEPQSPRQELTAAPYALHALNGPGQADVLWSANGANIRNTNSGFVNVLTNLRVGNFSLISDPEMEILLNVRRTGSQDAPEVVISNSNSLRATADLALLANGAAASLRVDAVTSIPGATQQFVLSADSEDMPIAFATQGIERMRLDGAGNLGIGTINPSHPLDIVGAARLRSNTATNLLVRGSNDDIYLDMIKNANTTASARILFNGFTNQSTHEGSIEFFTRQASDGAGTLPRRAEIAANGDMRLFAPSGTNTIQISPNFGGSTGGFMSLRHPSGSEGISLAARSASSGVGGLIEVKNNTGVAKVVITGDDGTGNGRVKTSILEVTGADLAEKFPSSAPACPGTVMEIDPDQPGRLRVARGACNRRVAGVVSGANGLSAGAVLGNLPEDEHAPAIALSGRVWVQCDASGGAIQPGDLLTTADHPGRAMKVTEYSRAQGAIIGKAMTPLESGAGLVLVLVSLQ